MNSETLRRFRRPEDASPLSLWLRQATLDLLSDDAAESNTAPIARETAVCSHETAEHSHACPVPCQGKSDIPLEYFMTAREYKPDVLFLLCTSYEEFEQLWHAMIGRESET